MKSDKLPLKLFKTGQITPEEVWDGDFATVIMVLNFSFLFYFG
jgi:hypothetical protein